MMQFLTFQFELRYFFYSGNEQKKNNNEKRSLLRFQLEFVASVYSLSVS